MSVTKIVLTANGVRDEAITVKGVGRLVVAPQNFVAIRSLEIYHERQNDRQKRDLHDERSRFPFEFQKPTGYCAEKFNKSFFGKMSLSMPGKQLRF